MSDQVGRELLQVKRFETSSGAQIFQIPVRQFPILRGFVYLVLTSDHESGDMRVLIDSGSGFGDSNQDLEDGLEAVSGQLGHRIGLEDLTHVLITHGHIDHFGGLSYVRPRTNARVGVHEFDLRNLANYEERLTIVSRRLENFLVEAGVPEERGVKLIDLYKITKSLFRSVEVQFTYEAIGMQLGPFRMLHVPGHCAGHVVIRLSEVLFSGDHILKETSPHQSPEHLALFTGLDHYLESLEKLKSWAKGVRLTLGGHEDPIEDLPGRIAEIKNLHEQRVAQVLKILDQPHTIDEISHILFGEVHGYHVLLALEEAGAHVEYLYQRGALAIDNLTELESSRKPAAIYYRRL